MTALGYVGALLFFIGFVGVLFFIYGNVLALIGFAAILLLGLFALVFDIFDARSKSQP